MSDRRVKFQISSSGKGSPRSHRSRDPAHDSGVGSSSSEQASIGGRPDRRFTAEDYEDQLYNVGALQEALGQANKKVEQLQQKCIDLDNELAKAHRATRDAEKRFREECEKNKRIDELNKEFENDRVVLEVQIKELKADYNNMRDERDDLRQMYLGLVDPVLDNTMRGGSGEPSSPRLGRSGSKYDRESRVPSRRHAEHREEKAGSSRHHRRSSSMSVKPGARSSSKRPYIERMPEPPSPSRRVSGNYIATTSDYPSVSRTEPAVYSSVPRVSPPASYHSVNDVPSTGDYIQYPLKERGRRRG
ncbi:hypothetical protein F4677DRAFT_268672 [Hypoxylon crocopeplum]|nr:hypothetical protein F4677DRAFT_268672 [Hypoxylon crocopeplum]